MICPGCGTKNDDATDNCFKCGKGLYALTEGAILSSRYEVLSLLGRGGMGLVYKAYDRDLEEMVALKVLRFDVARTGDVARRFRSEIKLARKVRHPNVCGIHEYGSDGPYRFIVMELIEGQDLRRILHERGAFPPEEACSLAIEVTEGLQAIHAVGIVHRDLKSPNIMLDRSGRVRLMDFGIAKQTGAEATGGSATATGLVLGTPEYMSPEQARGKKVDFRSDIYALGILAYELFTGHVPFKGETPLETIFKHLQEKPVFAGPEAPGIPDAFVPVLTKALGKAPEERYATARDMTLALRQARVEAFGASVKKTTPRIMTATAPDTYRMPETQTVPTPAPSHAPTVVPTITSKKTAVGAPTAVPEQTVETGAAAARRTPRPSPSAGQWRPVWIAGAAFAVAACLAGAMYLTRGSAGPESPGELQLTPEGAVPSPAVGPTSGPLPTPLGDPGSSSDQAEVGEDDKPSPPTERNESAKPSLIVPRAPAARPTPAPPRPTAVVPTPIPLKFDEPPQPAPEPPAPVVTPRGQLQLRILPWAKVSVDGRTVGTTPMRPIAIDVGEHQLTLSHPNFLPLQKTVLIRADETTTLEVDLSYEAFPR